MTEKLSPESTEKLRAEYNNILVRNAQFETAIGKNHQGFVALTNIPTSPTSVLFVGENPSGQGPNDREHKIPEQNFFSDGTYRLALMLLGMSGVDLSKTVGWQFTDASFFRRPRCSTPHKKSCTQCTEFLAQKNGARETCEAANAVFIDILKPRLIVALGAPALKHLHKIGKGDWTQNLTQLVGRSVQITIKGSPYTVVPLFHPTGQGLEAKNLKASTLSLRDHLKRFTPPPAPHPCADRSSS